MIDFTTGERLVGVVGAGAMGQGIAQVALQGGLSVLLTDAREGAAAAGADRISERLERLVQKDRLQAADVTAMRGRLRVVPGLDGFALADAVIEAVVEDLEVKRAVFADLERIVRPDCLLATNTSSLPVTSIARACRHRGRVAGMHFFNPVPLMRLVELVRGLGTDEATLDALDGLARRLGRTPVRVQDSPGFLVNLGGRAYTTEALRLLQEGVATPARIDAILKDAGGFPMGPFELMDLTGLDVNYPVTRVIFEEFQNDPRLRTTPHHKLLMEAGRLGRKAGIGHYAYDAQGRRLDAYESDHVSDAPPATAAVVPEPDLRLAALLQAVRIEPLARDDGEAPIVGAPIGEDATTFATRTGVDHRRLVVLDVLGDTRTRVTLMTAPGADPGVRARLAAAFAAAGRKPTLIADSPGFVLQRVAAVIANLGAEMAQMGLASPEDIDRAMELGLNYPKGPFALAEEIGAAEVLRIMSRLQAITGDDRYRPSLWLRRRALLGLPLRTPG